MPGDTARPDGRPATRQRAAGRRAPRWRLLLAVVLLLAAGGVAVRVLTEAGPACQQALIPAYFYPGAGWNEAIGGKPPPRLMIMDMTSSGAGPAPDRNYQAVARRAQAAGITLAGYSDTDYGRRPAAAVEADVQHYRSWYGVRDVFLDRVSGNARDLAYYQRLSGYVHQAAPGSLVILNPGDYPRPSYMSAGDIIVAFEGSYAQYTRIAVPPWAGRYPAARFATLIYGVPAALLPGAIGAARRGHAGYVYVTSETGANPYGSLPGYWSREDAILTAC
jgi:hypothetical protein